MNKDLALAQPNVAFSTQHRNLVKASEHLLGICSGIIADSHIHPQEIEFLHNWMHNYPDVIKSWPGSAIHHCIETIIDDGIITPDEQTHLLETLQRITGNQFADTGSAATEVAGIPFDDDPHVMFNGMCFCFTGRFMYGTRSACEKLVEQRGAVTLQNVVTDLDYLVVGSMVEPSWANTSYGRKIETALRYIEKGRGIAIIKESDWHAALKS